MPSKETIEALYKRYLNNDISEEELEEFVQLLHTPEDELTVSSLMDGTWQEMFDPSLRQAKDKLLRMTKQAKVIPLYKRRWNRVAAASVIILLLSVGGYLYFNKKTPLRQAQGDMVQVKRFKNDVAPGGNKAILTLANGKQIILDSAANGTITQQDNTKIIKLDSGVVAYKEASGSSHLGEAGVGYNTISTPKGGQYQIVLADGSKVWLNAASSLRFPASFKGKERDVELAGEGYFEIAKNAAMPFHVKVNDMLVEVLGTHFNINAYNDESIIKTTLLEGSVKVSLLSLASSPSPLERAGVRLKPGQQAQLNADQLKIINNANIDATVAWKNGVFRFESEDIETVMRQLSRWYDVDVNYRVKTNKHFTGIISRNVNASEVLKMLEMTGEMHFAIDGKKVTVEK